MLPLGREDGLSQGERLDTARKKTVTEAGPRGKV
jgi:hypothetical protein